MLTAALLATTFQISTLDSILSNPSLDGALVSATVLNDHGAPIYERLSSTRVVPASNQKLVSSLYALETLGPNFVPVTRFGFDGKKTLYVESKGDPTMTFERLKWVRDQFKVPKGTLVRIKSAYNPSYAPSWEWDDLPNRYAPKITAFDVNEAGFELKLKGGQVEAPPREFHVTVVRRENAAESRVDFNPESGVARVFGKQSGTKVLDTLALPDPERTAAEWLGGTRGTPATTFPTGLRWIESPGLPLRDIVKETLVDSDNHGAEHLLMMAACSSQPFSAPSHKVYDQAASRMQKDFLDKVSPNPKDFRPIDGSGLSRHNFVTTRGLANLLAWAQARPWFNDFYSGLVTSSNGTLKSRNAGETFHGKTGTLNSVVALSGYVTTKAGKRVIFSAIFNHGTTPASEQRAVIDEFARSLADL